MEWEEQVMAITRPKGSLPKPYCARHGDNEMNLLLLLLFALFIMSTGSLGAQTGDAGKESVPKIRAGAIELGLAGSMTSIDGISNAVLYLRGGSFIDAIGGRGGAEVELSYAHSSIADQAGIEGNISWIYLFSGSPLIPYVAVGGGVRQEWIGSFSQIRYPIGASAGVRTMVGNRAAIRIDYLFRRITNDPVADYSEHRIVIGLSIFFNNSRSD
jgi:hypothetical protein